MGTLGLSPKFVLPTLEQRTGFELSDMSSAHWETMRGPEDTWRPHPPGWLGPASACDLNTETFFVFYTGSLGQ